MAATKSSDVDVVTEADRASEALIRAHLRAARPDDGFLGEEGDDVAEQHRRALDRRPDRRHRQLPLRHPAVRRLDRGRASTARSSPAWSSTSRAGTEYVGHLADGDRPGVGDPRRRSRSPCAARRRWRSGWSRTGFSYDRRVRVLQAEAVTRLLPLVRDIRRLGSCALDLCLVADGRLDGYVEEGVNLWDHAAGGLIARIAGARTLVHRRASGAWT